MNKEIIPISPIFDKTPYDSRIHQRKRKIKFKAGLSISKIISALCLLNVIACAVFFVGGSSTLREEARYFMIENLYAGLIETADPSPEEKPTGSNTEASVPAAAEPKEENADEQNDEAREVLKSFLNLYEFDPSLVPEGTYPIIPYDLSSESDGELRLYNDTFMNIDINQYARSEPSVGAMASTDEPIVLIIHTHGTEAYSEEGVYGYSDTYNIPRSYDVTKNVIHIGDVIARILNENGVCTVHCDVMHDAESYLGAYDRSSETIDEYLNRYPSIKYVFDVHRDSVLLEDKTKTRPITLVNGEIAAQIMTVVGTDELGTFHPNWETNLKLAAKLQVELNASNLGLTRAICLRGSSYNQEQAPYSLLFEVGSCGNTIKEAEVSAEIPANKLAELIKSGW